MVYLVLILFLPVTASCAQSMTGPSRLETIEVTGTTLSSTLIPPGVGDTTSSVPDAPVARLSDSACQVGTRHSCDPWGRQLYWPSSLTRKDDSWRKAVMNPRVFAVSSLLVAAFITDYKTTRSCVDRHLGREANPPSWPESCTGNGCRAQPHRGFDMGCGHHQKARRRQCCRYRRVDRYNAARIRSGPQRDGVQVLIQHESHDR
jgi:hypothetical protein